MSLKFKEPEMLLPAQTLAGEQITPPPPAPSEKANPLTQLIEAMFNLWDFRKNTLTGNTEYKAKEDKNFEHCDEEAINTLCIRLSQLGFASSIRKIDMVINSKLVAHYQHFQAFFSNLPAPTGFDYIAELASTLVLENREYTLLPEQLQYLGLDSSTGKTTQKVLFTIYLKKWLAAAVGCGQGYKVNDVCLVLTGAQGKGKSTWLNALFPNMDYVVCGHIEPSLTVNATANFLAEKFVINIDDQLEVIFGKDYNSLKSVISAPSVNNRKAFRRDDKNRMRVANFVASVNKKSFLTDVENRRYLCFSIEDVSREHSNIINRNLVWAQAVELFNSQKNTFGQIDYQIMQVMNRAFTKQGIEEDLLLSKFRVAADGEDEELVKYYTHSEIYTILRDDGKNVLSTHTLGTALERNGFKSKGKRLERYNMQPRDCFRVVQL